MYQLFGKKYKNLLKVAESGLSVVPIGTLYSRINKGWNILDAISTPPYHHPKSLDLRIIELTSFGIYTSKQIAEIVGTSPKLVENVLAKINNL